MITKRGQWNNIKLDTSWQINWLENPKTKKLKKEKKRKKVASSESNDSSSEF